MKLNKEAMDRIGEEHGIGPTHRKEFLKLANDGKITKEQGLP